MAAKRGRPPKKKEPQEESPDMLTSQQEVIDYLQMSRGQFQRLLAKYPFVKSGAPGKINGRWHVERVKVRAWWELVQYQEAQALRHPDMRRMRPVEPPELSSIKGR
jgi:hypothetical protein